MKAVRLPLLICLLAVLALSGCVAAPPKAKAVRYLWPPSATDAKIEYLGFYASEANVKEEMKFTVANVILGVEPAKPLLASPFAVDAWMGRMVVTDSTSRRSFLFDLNERAVKEIIPPKESSSTRRFPGGVAIFDEHSVLLVDSIAGQVEHLTFDDELLGIFGKGELSRPTAVAIDRRHKQIVVVEPSRHRLALFTYNGTLLGYLGERGSGPGQFNFPLDADFDSDGNLFVIDSLNYRVQRFDWNGRGYTYRLHFGEQGTASGSFERPKSLAVSPSGHIYVTDALAHKVVVFDRNGSFLLNFGGKFAAADGKLAPGGFYMPNGIAADDRDGIWVVDSLNRMVHHFQYLNDAYKQAHPILPEQLAPADAPTNAGGG